MRDESQPFHAIDDPRGAILVDADGEERTARRGTKPGRACTRCGACKLFERGRIRMAEGKTEAERHMTVAHRMRADRIRRRAQRRGREIDADVGDRAAERACTAGGEYLPGARPARRDHLEHAQCCVDAMLGRDRADRPCGGGISADTHAKVDAPTARLRVEPHIGRDPVEVQGTATVDRD